MLICGIECTDKKTVGKEKDKETNCPYKQLFAEIWEENRKPI
jgi:hypothetical protein